MHRGCHGRRPRDWSRFEREMRVWGRQFERDMSAMGERIEKDMETMFEDGRHDEGAHGGRCRGRGRRHGWRHPRRPRGRWTRDGAFVFGFWGDADGDRNGGAAAASRGGCTPGRHGFAGFHALWVLFPLFFIGPAFLRSLGGWDGVGAGLANGFAAMLNYTLAAPVARLLSESLGVSFLQGYGVLMLSVAVTVTVAIIGLRAGRPAR